MSGGGGGLFLVVAYDVPVDRRRQRLAKCLLDYGERVQYSVFEMDLRSRETFERMLYRVRREVNTDEDSVRVYQVCPACRRAVICIGVAEPVQRQDLFVI